jgi:DNA-directed RNA polymerase subunit RPC12/RpoP
MFYEYPEDPFTYVVVCPECGEELTEILEYGRYFCENCQLHY